MQWTLYDLPPEITAEDTPPSRDVLDFDPPDLERPEFPTLTDCPLCRSRDPETCGCFDKSREL